MRYKTQWECMDKKCNTVIVGPESRLDGFICPRCHGPVIPKPFVPKKKISEDALYVRRMIVEQRKKDYFDLSPEQVETVLEIYKEKLSKSGTIKSNFKINFNEQVKVKLTDIGIKILKEQHDQLSKVVKELNGKGLGEFQNKVDEDGYSSFQIWSLMNDFGQYMQLCYGPPFESEMIFCNGELLGG